ncbi:HEPN domain-containing protein [Dysgonomonas sp. Marseille-P4677]|uniref:HEPN domain-containing protein n=1 Tax=Dysgonomonas sp. Marseille-P4677 TaxID=2364790 RepID=UPI0019121553|nr:HEPN domain-containing protein [Dysgonomonas sp. Marseille-P4677]MBK5722134.1 HEPN domain-containing protein [Dysgonomonas sp. Marseille-P4677]
MARKRKLNYTEIKQQTEEYFNEKFEKGNFFFDDAITNKERNRYQMASFYLHQACENYYYAIRLVFTLKSNKQHNLSKLSSSVKSYSPDLANVFPLLPAEEKRLFDLIKAAYVEARYNPKFVVTKEDIDALIPKVELLRGITKRICEGEIGEYGEK